MKITIDKNKTSKIIKVKLKKMKIKLKNKTHRRPKLPLERK